MLGEVKWSRRPVGRRVLEELVEKTGRVVPAGDWKVHYALFARAGFSDPVREAAHQHNALLIDLERLDRDLSSRVKGSGR
ncbi:MAG: hypothetical protein AAF560_19745 [Acidobacteriota bacterium]